MKTPYILSFGKKTDFKDSICPNIFFVLKVFSRITGPDSCVEI